MQSLLQVRLGLLILSPPPGNTPPDNMPPDNLPPGFMPPPPNQPPPNQPPPNQPPAQPAPPPANAPADPVVAPPEDPAALAPPAAAAPTCQWCNGDVNPGNRYCWKCKLFAAGIVLGSVLVVMVGAVITAVFLLIALRGGR